MRYLPHSGKQMAKFSAHTGVLIKQAGSLLEKDRQVLIFLFKFIFLSFSTNFFIN